MEGAKGEQEEAHGGMPRQGRQAEQPRPHAAIAGMSLHPL